MKHGIQQKLWKFTCVALKFNENLIHHFAHIHSAFSFLLHLNEKICNCTINCISSLQFQIIHVNLSDIVCKSLKEHSKGDELRRGHSKYWAL